jgi:hypothetical protein
MTAADVAALTDLTPDEVEVLLGLGGGGAAGGLSSAQHQQQQQQQDGGSNQLVLLPGVAGAGGREPVAILSSRLEAALTAVMREVEGQGASLQTASLSVPDVAGALLTAVAALVAAAAAAQAGLAAVLRAGHLVPAA